MLGARESLTICLATVLSLHCSIMLYNTSFHTIILAVSAAVFLSKGLLLCETLRETSLSTGNSPGKGGRPLTIFSLPLQLPTFLVHLRTIALMLTPMLMVSLIAMRHGKFALLEKTLTVGWWNSQVVIVSVECGRWFLICFLVLPLF